MQHRQSRSNGDGNGDENRGHAEVQVMVEAIIQIAAPQVIHYTVSTTIGSFFCAFQSASCTLHTRCVVYIALFSADKDQDVGKFRGKLSPMNKGGRSVRDREARKLTKARSIELDSRSKKGDKPNLTLLFAGFLRLFNTDSGHWF